MKQVFRKSAMVGLAIAVAGVAVAMVAGGATARSTANISDLRPAAGHEVVRPLGAVRRAGLEEGAGQGGRGLLDHERVE